MTNPAPAEATALDGSELRTIAVEALDAALERLSDVGSLPAYDALVRRIHDLLEDGVSDFPESDARLIVAEVLATRLYRAAGTRIYNRGVFTES